MWKTNASEVNELLARWRGSRGQAWSYSSSLAQFLIRFYRDEPSPIQSAYLHCAGCRKVSFDTHWQDSSIQILSTPDGRFRISDGERLHVECGIVQAAEIDDLITFDSVPGA